LVETLAASVRVASYSARARLTLESLERIAASGEDLSLEVPVGADQLGWVCAFHRASERRTGPLVIVDGTASTAHPAEFWSEPFDAPTARAEGGTLVVLNVAGLPQAAQDALAVALSRRSSGEHSFGLVATLPEPPEQLLEERLLSRALAQFLLPNVLSLPTLMERPEDLRALIMDRLCRSGVRFGGEPLGIEPQALSRLVDYAWPGNEAELRSVVERAAHAAAGERVSAADLSAIGFEPALSAMEVPAVARAQKERFSVALEIARGPELMDKARPGVRRRRRR
jgi:DNA-binding NtrC family response regulator